MSANSKYGSVALIVLLVATFSGLGAWKHSALRTAEAAAADQPEYFESVTSAVAVQGEYRPTTTAIGTVVARRSITLRNELPGTVHTVALAPGQIVEAGTVLVALDVSVETAELQANLAQVALAESVYARVEALRQDHAVSVEELDRARADRDVARAELARTRAIIERKTIRAPFRSRVGLSDVHPGQYLNEGTSLTTLQGIDDSVYVDFAVEQQLATHLNAGDPIEVVVSNGAERTLPAQIVAIDARVDSRTRNATVRAQLGESEYTPAPGASVRVSVPAGNPQSVVFVPATSVRKSPDGDHVFVLAIDADGKPRANIRPVSVIAMTGDEAIVADGLAAGELVAATGSFKLRQNVLVALSDPASLSFAGGL